MPFIVEIETSGPSEEHIKILTKSKVYEKSHFEYNLKKPFFIQARGGSPLSTFFYPEHLGNFQLSKVFGFVRATIFRFLTKKVVV